MSKITLKGNKTRKIIAVNWIDSTSHHTGWTDDVHPDNTFCSSILTIGIVLREDNETITLTNSSDYFGQYLDNIVIPKGCIRNIYDLKMDEKAVQKALQTPGGRMS